jgi:hypothetical protein
MAKRSAAMLISLAIGTGIEDNKIVAVPPPLLNKEEQPCPNAGFSLLPYICVS